MKCVLNQPSMFNEYQAAMAIMSILERIMSNAFRINSFLVSGLGPTGDGNIRFGFYKVYI